MKSWHFVKRMKIKSLRYLIKLIIPLSLLFLYQLDTICQEYPFSKDIKFKISIINSNILYVDDNTITIPWTRTSSHPFQNIPEDIAIEDFGVTVNVLPGIYPILSDIMVEQDVTLLLYTCVNIKFNLNVGSEIDCILLVYGARYYNIVFTSSQNYNSCKGIRFEVAQNYEFKFCKINNSEGWEEGKGGAIYANSTSPDIFRCLLQNNSTAFSGVVFCDSLTKPVIKGSILKKNIALVKLLATSS